MSVSHNIEFTCPNCGSFMYLQDVEEGPSARLVNDVNGNDHRSYDADRVPLAVAAVAAGQTVKCGDCGCWGTVTPERLAISLTVIDVAYHVEAAWEGAVPGVIQVGSRVVCPFGGIGTLRKVCRDVADVELEVGSWSGPLNALGLAPVPVVPVKEPVPYLDGDAPLHEKKRRH